MCHLVWRKGQPLDSSSIFADRAPLELISTWGHPVSGLLRAPVLSALQYIIANYNRPIRARDIASAANCSRSHVYETFRQVLGMSVMEFTTALRLARAEELLSRGHQVKAVAVEVGYRSPVAFAIAFRRAFGVSPSSVRGSRTLELDGCN
jgi:AraC-like DNA-binding protein